MNTKLLTAVLFAVLMAGCAQHHHRGDHKSANNTMPQVSVVSGRIVVPSVLVFTRPTAVTVTWQLPADSKSRFAENGIVIEGKLIDEVIRGDKVSVVLDARQTEIADCRRSKDGLEFSCLNRYTQPGIYKYTIRFIDESGKPLSIDPTIVNM